MLHRGWKRCCVLALRGVAHGAMSLCYAQTHATRATVTRQTLYAIAASVHTAVESRSLSLLLFSPIHHTTILRTDNREIVYGQHSPLHWSAPKCCVVNCDEKCVCCVWGRTRVGEVCMLMSWILATITQLSMSMYTLRLCLWVLRWCVCCDRTRVSAVRFMWINKHVWV